MSVRFEGRTSQVGLRAKLREALSYAEEVQALNEKLEAAEEREAIRGRCHHLCCRRRYDELLKLRDAAPRRASTSGGRNSAQVALEIQVREQQARIKELEREVLQEGYRRTHERKTAKQAASLASSKGTALDAAKLQLQARDEALEITTKLKVQLEERTLHQKERLRTLQERSKDLERQCKQASAALEAAEEKCGGSGGRDVRVECRGVAEGGGSPFGEERGATEAEDLENKDWAAQR